MGYRSLLSSALKWPEIGKWLPWRREMWVSVPFSPGVRHEDRFQRVLLQMQGTHPYLIFHWSTLLTKQYHFLLQITLESNTLAGRFDSKVTEWRHPRLTPFMYQKVWGPGLSPLGTKGHWEALNGCLVQITKATPEYWHRKGISNGDGKEGGKWKPNYLLSWRWALPDSGHLSRLLVTVSNVVRRWHLPPMLFPNMSSLLWN